MHEAGLLAEAVDRALRSMPARAGAGTGDGGEPVPTALEVRIVDPLHVAPESARMHAELALRARGLAGVPVLIVSMPLDCAFCGVANDPLPSHPFCAGCGFPLPVREGPAVEAALRW